MFSLLTLTPMPWVVSCLWRCAFWRKVWSQREQWKGQTSACMRMCSTRLCDLPNILPHTSPFSNTQLHVLLFPVPSIDFTW